MNYREALATRRPMHPTIEMAMVVASGRISMGLPVAKTVANLGPTKVADEPRESVRVITLPRWRQ